MILMWESTSKNQRRLETGKEANHLLLEQKMGPDYSFRG